MSDREESALGTTRPAPDDETATGLPGLRTWRGVYLAVLGVFALWVGLLWWLSAAFR